MVSLNKQGLVDKVIKILKKGYKKEFKRDIKSYEIWIIENTIHHTLKILKKNKIVYMKKD